MSAMGKRRAPAAGGKKGAAQKEQGGACPTKEPERARRAHKDTAEAHPVTKRELRKHTRRGRKKKGRKKRAHTQREREKDAHTDNVVRKVEDTSTSTGRPRDTHREADEAVTGVRDTESRRKKKKKRRNREEGWRKAAAWAEEKRKREEGHGAQNRPQEGVSEREWERRGERSTSVADGCGQRVRGELKNDTVVGTSFGCRYRGGGSWLCRRFRCLALRLTTPPDQRHRTDTSKQTRTCVCGRDTARRAKRQQERKKKGLDHRSSRK